jgi:hypothetical protein
VRTVAARSSTSLTWPAAACAPPDGVLDDHGQGVAFGGQVQGLGAAVLGIVAALDQAGGAQLVEDADQGRPLHAQLLGQYALAHAAARAGDVQHRQGAGVRQVVLGQGAVDLAPVDPGQAQQRAGEGAFVEKARGEVSSA